MKKILIISFLFLVYLTSNAQKAVDYEFYDYSDTAFTIDLNNKVVSILIVNSDASDTIFVEGTSGNINGIRSNYWAILPEDFPLTLGTPELYIIKRLYIHSKGRIKLIIAYLNKY